ncbi:MAG TPA: PQQ-dependent sugar dehydrogenase [Candidatus Paceibacterota bacterium]
MNKTFFLIVGLVLVGAVAWAGFSYWEQIWGLGPAPTVPSGPADDIGGNNTDFPLRLPAGFSISVFAKDLPGARVMAFDGMGNMWVSQTSEGKISLLEVEDGKVQNQTAVLQNLNRPHGLAFHPQQDLLLYFVEQDGVSRVPTYSEGAPEKLFDLPATGGHFTRTMLFAPDGRLLTSVGSSCNVCHEEDWRRATVLVSDDRGNNLQVFAKGLRNAVFMATHYVTGDIWVTEMGRDNLGDNTPPDEINIIGSPSTSSGQNSIPNFGWPICYGKNIHDTQFDKNTYIRNPCDEQFGEIPSHVDLQAHSAPLGLAFVPEEGWPEEYWYDLLVAFHGSWNRTEPTGYKIVRVKLDAQGNYESTEDFISGWLQGGQALGRPVDILIQPGGVMYVSDDKAGLIYKVTYQGN